MTSSRSRELAEHLEHLAKTPSLHSRRESLDAAVVSARWYDDAKEAMTQAAAFLRAALPSQEQAQECTRCLWKRGNADEFAQLLRRVEKARRAQDLGLEVLQQLAERAQESRAWQDIATAPKDGRHFIAFDAGAGQLLFTAHWGDGHWMTEYELWKGPMTHWRPLPEPPQVEARASRLSAGDEP